MIIENLNLQLENNLKNHFKIKGIIFRNLV